MLDLKEPRRQSPKSILIYVAKNVKGLIAIVLYSAFGARNFDNFWLVAGVAVAVAAILFISPLLNYYYFTFHVENDELIIQKGLLNKERKAIPLERIQSVNITQNLVQRVLQLVAVEVETAGSKAKELEIPGLDREFAVAFKNLLQEKRESNEDLEEVDVEAKSQLSQERKAVEGVDLKKKTELLSLGLMDLLKIGITQNHLRSGGLAMAVTFGFWYNIKDFVEEFYGDIFEGFEWENVIGYASLSLVLIGFLVFTLFSILVSILLVINKYYGYKLTRSGSYLEIEMGLLNRREIKIPIEKIQILEFHTNPLRRLLNYHTASIHQAQSQGNAVSGAEVPACSPAMMTMLQDLIFDHPTLETPVQLDSYPSSHARLTTYIVALPLILGVAACIYLEIYWAMSVPLVVFGWMIYKSYKDGKYTSIQTDVELVVMRSGWIFHSIRIIPVYKMQAVEKWRSIFLKKRQQIHLTLHTAAGSRGLRYFDEKKITALKNRLNNQVLASERSWM